VPFSWIEGALGPSVYEAVYAPHPFKLDGDERYLGFRPMGFFEHGNQFGLWISLCALVAVWCARNGSGRYKTPLAILLVVMALAAQSVGGILILGLGAAFLSICGHLRPRLMVALGLSALLVGGAVYVSGVVPIQQLGRDTAVGRQMIQALRSVGRGSLAWRISQDQKLLPAATAHPVTGTAAWDWWRSKNMRPWGLWLLMLGQFGLVGLGLCLSTLLWPALREGWRAHRASGWQAASQPLLLASLIGLAVLDAFMNSFIFFPAVVLAGGLANRSDG
jgi:hypothetical protein